MPTDPVHNPIHAFSKFDELLQAITSIGSSFDVQMILKQIIAAAQELTAAKYVALGILNESHDELDQFVYTGITPEEAKNIGNLPIGKGLLGTIIQNPRPYRLADISHEIDASWPKHHPKMTSFLGVPIFVKDKVFGNLYLCNKSTDTTFTQEDEDIVVTLASVAGLALEQTTMHTELARLRIIEDRERIARDLHDVVIQQLFASGLHLQRILSQIEKPPLDPVQISTSLENTIDLLDTTIKDIRTTIFQLHENNNSVQQRPIFSTTIRDRIEEICESYRALHSFTISTTYDPSSQWKDNAFHITNAMMHDISACIHECLTNVVKHSQASKVTINVRTENSNLLCTIENNGIPREQVSSVRSPLHGNGLRNIINRVEQYQGYCSYHVSNNGLFHVTWSIPVDNDLT